MDHALMGLYHRHVARAFDRQMHLADFLEHQASDENWTYRISSATLQFGSNVQFSALDLGSHAEPDNSWLWSWCHPHLNLTPANRELADSVRNLGRAFGIPAFTVERQISCDELFGQEVSPDTAHIFAAIASGDLGFDAYYTMPFRHGRMAAVIRDDRLKVEVPDPAMRILSIFPRAIDAFPIPNQHEAFVAYVASYGLDLEQEAKSVGVFANGNVALNAKLVTL
jgi:hypothetical protein